MKTMKKIISIILVICMMASVMPANAFAAEAEGKIALEDVELKVINKSIIENKITTFALDGDGNPALKDSNEVEWIDRVEQMPYYAYDFYDWFVENTDGDGTDDALINPTTALDYAGDGTQYASIIGEITGLKAEFTYPENATAAEIKEIASETYNDSVDQLLYTTYSYILTAFSAFDRDYPEVFWLSGDCPYGIKPVNASYGVSETKAGEGSVEYDAQLCFILIDKKDSIDVRMPSYRDYTKIYDSIEDRDAWVEQILADVPESAEGKVKYFNEWLTKNNAYNSIGDFNNVPAESLECISALEGNVGEKGPVCEGYARAFNVLCDETGIPCVLVSGTAFGGDHMWNNVQMDDGKWYAVDVTWNDPMTSDEDEKESGNENEIYLLVGSDTYIKQDDATFAESHVVENLVVEGGTAFVNGPVLSEEAYFKCEHPELQFVEGIEPTCTEDGYKAYYECECGAVFEDAEGTILVKDMDSLIIPATGHTYKTATTAPTCTEKGYTIYACECGDSYFDDYVDALGHTFSEWTVTIAPTCTTVGEEERSCACGKVETREVAMAEHAYDEAPEFIWSSDSKECTAVFTCSFDCGTTEEVECKVTATSPDATCTTPGTVKYTATCTMNGVSYTDSKSVKDAVLDHDIVVEFKWYDDNTVCYAAVSCTRCEDISATITCDITVTETEKGIEHKAVAVYEGVTYEDVILDIVLPFTDVNETDWFYNEVKYVFEHDLMNGTSATAFAPNKTLTRGMFATILYRAHGKPEVEYEEVFKDVPEGEWYTDGIIWAYQNNIVQGYGNDKFGVDDNISREQLAVMMYRYAKFMEYDITKTADVSVYEDAGQIDSWAEEAMAWAVGNEIVKGKSDTKLSPLGEATRAECAAIIMRFLELYK